MKNPKFILIGAIVVVVAVVGVYLIIGNSQKNVGNNFVADRNEVENGAENNVADNEDSIAKSGNICDIFSKESIASITGLDIVSAESYSVEGTENSNCRYYIRGRTYAPVLSIGKYQSDPALAKAKYEDEIFKDWRVLTGKQITMNHFVTYNEVQQLNDIYLITGSNEYYRIALHALSALKSQQMINLALQIVEKLTATDGSQGFQEEEASVSQELITKSFLDNLASKKIDDALKMMDANENTKQMWGVNFNTIESLEVKKIEEVFQS